MRRASREDFPFLSHPVPAGMGVYPGFIHVWFRSIDGGIRGDDAVGAAAVAMVEDDEAAAGFARSQQLSQQNNFSFSRDALEVFFFLLLVLVVVSVALPHSR